MLIDASNLRVVRPPIQLCQQLASLLQVNQRLFVLPAHVLDTHEEDTSEQPSQRPGERIIHLHQQTRNSLVVLLKREVWMGTREGAICGGHGAAEGLV